MPVPDGIALSYEFVDSIVKGDESTITQLSDECAQIAGPFAVRSSAIGEDGAAASFAGQHTTILNVVDTPSVLYAVRSVWESGRSESAIAYRTRMGTDMDVQIGVVIQKQILSDVSGVLFSRNPITGGAELLIEASWGLGEAIVQGLVIPDRFRVSLDGNVLEQSTGVKDIAIKPDGVGNVQQVPVSSDLVKTLCLDATKLNALRELVFLCDEIFGKTPHDIEWAIQNDQLFLLQRRPITGLS